MLLMMKKKQSIVAGYLKITALQSSTVYCDEIDSMHEQECGWQNAVIMIGNRKKVALITVYRMVDANSRGLNSGKVQHEIIIGKVTSTKTIRNK